MNRGIMPIDMRLTDREVVLVLTLCRLLGKPTTMQDAENACLLSVEQVNRETAQLIEDPNEDD